MKDKHGELWIGAEDLTKDESFIRQSQEEHQIVSLSKPLEDAELAETLSSSRRDFLKYLGFGLGAATVAASCEIPIKRAIPYVIKPDEIVPGVATYYASSFVNGGDYCSILVKTREGRPIKIEGNSLSPVTRGGTSARAQASVLGLYDINRLKGPKKQDEGTWSEVSWNALDEAVKSQIAEGKAVRILSHTQMSPSVKKMVEDWQGNGVDVQWISYDPVSASAMLDANQSDFGVRALPSYHFDTAKCIVSFNADFLGTWISPVEFASQYAVNRKIKDEKNASMSRHIQVESQMSLTGSNADNRILVKPSEQGAAIAYLYNEIAKSTGETQVTAPALNDKAKAALQKVAVELLANRGESLVVSSSNHLVEQQLVNRMNALLGNIGKTVDFSRVSYQRQGDDKAVKTLLEELKSGSVGTFILWNANPAYELPYGNEFEAAIGNAGISVSVCGSLNETARACGWLAPSHHLLESWGDVEVKDGELSLVQPTISPLFNTRQGEESILVWSGHPSISEGKEQPYYEYIKGYWRDRLFARQSKYVSFQNFWDSALHDGVVSIPATSGSVSYQGGNIDASRITPASDEMEISYYETVNMGAGQFADNPWLMETPDPVTRCVWGNYLSIPVSFDGDRRFESYQGLKDGDQVDLTINGTTRRVTIIRQFGQMPGTFGLALGYGRTEAGKCGSDVGVDVNAWRPVVEGYTQNYNVGVTVSSKVSEDKEFACVQHHHTMGVTAEDNETGETFNADEAALVDDVYKPITKGFQGSLTSRSIIRKSHVKDLDKFTEELEKERAYFQKLNSYTLYDGHEDKYSKGHHWGMHVDLICMYRM
jgi:hypothetical protein